MAEMVHLSGPLTAFMQELDAASNRGGILGVRTGLPLLDLITGGLHRSDLVVLGGVPSAGIGTLAVTIAAHAALHDRAAVAFVTGGLSHAQLERRLLCADAQVPLATVGVGRLDEGQRARLADSRASLDHATVWISDAPLLSLNDLRRAARELPGLRLMVVHRVDHVLGDEDIGTATRAIKALARETGATILVTTSVASDVEQRFAPFPRILDLPGEGDLEEAADLVMLLQTHQGFEPGEPRRRRADLTVNKQRNGPIGWLELMLLVDCGRFVMADSEAAVA